MMLYNSTIKLAKCVVKPPTRAWEYSRALTAGSAPGVLASIATLLAQVHGTKLKLDCKPRGLAIPGSCISNEAASDSLSIFTSP